MLKGIGVSKGYGIGKTIIIQEKSLEFTPKTDCNPEVELNRYHEAVDTFCKNTTAMAEKIKVSIGEKEAEILNGHILMIKDPYMNSEIEKLINNGQCAESSLTAICDMFAMVFSSSDDELTKQRATDVNDIKDGILSILLGIKEIDISCVPSNTVLIAKDLTPSMTACINKENIVGIVTEIGGKTSHSAILARAMEIPAVLSVPNVASILHDDDLVIVDGNDGTIIQNPTSEQVDDYTKKRVDFIEERKALSKYIGKETITQDGIKVELVGNIGNPENANSVVEFDGEGIGLFRTEFLFMDRNSAPTEEEQFDAYKKVALIMKGKPVIIRTLDIGGDKDIPYLNMKKEDNPFLGFRAIRYCIQNKELYRLQLKALVHASAFGDIRIMIPLVTCIDELRQVKTMIKGIMAELDVENISYNKDLKVGVMIETPSACLIADILAKESDFFSIGTNDLTQYTMAVDRGNPDVAYLYSAYNPAVIRSIKHIIDCAKTENIPVGMCGKTASDSLMIPILLSIGLDEFSVSPTSILATRKEISKWTKEKADNITQLVIQQTTEKDILEILKQSME